MHDTYYVVAQMGQTFMLNSATDYMLGTVNILTSLPFNRRTIYTCSIIERLNETDGKIRSLSDCSQSALSKLGQNKKYSLSCVNNQSISTSLDTQSAENLTGFSETIRQLPDSSFFK
jgi:hypothetical protein